MLYRALKRATDVLGALLGLVLFALPMLLIAVAIRLFLGPPVLFRQERPGWRARPFVIIKFRTMDPAREAARLPAAGERGDGGGAEAAPAGPASDGERLTRLGRFLRRTSLDELPELVNVLRGEMSIVGPRPLLPEYLERYTPEQARRHDVKPGMTGWAQVHGRNAISWEEKFALDLWYVDHAGYWLDLKIMALTLVKVLTLEGIAAPGHATMPEYQGSRPPPASASAHRSEVC